MSVASQPPLVAGANQPRDPALVASPSQTCCSILQKAGLQNVLDPSSEGYQDRVRSYWSVCARLRPYCIVQPRTAGEVAQVLTTLVSHTSYNFAVRSGGHTVWAGSNNIDNGVTIDLGLINKTTYDAESKTASIEPGATWGMVYQALEPHGVTVVGGRAAGVGVAGFLTGGGNSFYTARRGFACDNVVNFQVVLANGEIVDANASTNPDLFQALKGGVSNFGIVTRFDLDAFEAPDLWGGVVVYPASVSSQIIEAHVDWVDNIEHYQDGSSVLIFTHMPSLQGIHVLAAYEDTTGAVAAPAFDKFMAIPGQISSSMRVDTLLNLNKELDQAEGYSDVWFSLTTKNDRRVYEKAEKLHEQFVNDWKAQSPDGDFITQLIFQAMPTIFSDHSRARGGNVLGLDRETSNAVMMQCTLAVHGAEQTALARQRMKDYRGALKRATEELDAAVEWEYIGYADSLQDPLKNYGPANVDKMRVVAAKYDPEGIFQTRMPGGFKISKVQ